MKASYEYVFNGNMELDRGWSDYGTPFNNFQDDISFSGACGKTSKPFPLTVSQCQRL